MGELAGITTPRADLVDVSSPEKVTTLAVNTKDLKSFRGVERMVNLELISTHEGLTCDLTPLAQCRRLRRLNIAAAPGLSFVEDLPHLEHLSVYPNSQEAMERVSELDLSRAAYLDLFQVTAPTGKCWPVTLSWLSASASLRSLILSHVHPTSEGLVALAAMTQLEDVSFDPPPGRDGAALERELETALPTTFVRVNRERSSKPKVIDEGNGASPRFAVYIDIAGRWGTYANWEAAAELERRLDRATAELITLDPEADGVGIYSDERAALQNVLDLLESPEEA